MSKPDVALSRFASGPGEDRVVPSSGLRDTGFVDGTPAVPGYVNELFAQAYAWAQYLDDAVWDGDLEVDGSLTVDEDLDVSGDATINGDVTASDLKFTTTRSKYMPASAAQVLIGGTTPTYAGDPGWQHGTSTTPVIFPVALDNNDMITDWQVNLRKQSTSGTISAGLYAVDATNGSLTLIGALATNSANNPGYITLSNLTAGSALTQVVGGPLQIMVTSDGTNGNYTVSAGVVYKRP